jgi:CheY-like chemotaxis protein
VLLVDDHPQVLARLSTMLSEDFEVAAAVTDGSEALDAVRAVAPDLIVLDINMPRLGGLQTMLALTEAGSEIPVVFLSMFDEEEMIDAAFRSGGRGYVNKSHASRHLRSALEHVRDGRVFAPSLTSLLRLNSGSGAGHAMQLYGDPSFLDGLAALFDGALQRGDAACVIGTPEIREGLSMRLRDRGWDVQGLVRYRAVDTADALSRFMRDGLPDATVLADIAAELEGYRRGVTDGSRRLTLFGNMAERLIVAGNHDAAVALENIWSAVTHDLPFFTVCGYHASCFRQNDTNLWSSVCAQHDAFTQTGDAS